MLGIISKIFAAVLPRAVIPKPQTDREHRVKGWGTRRRERALIYRIPNVRKPSHPHQKRRDRLSVATGIRTTDVDW